MPMQVCMGAMMQCTFGMAPSSLVVLPTNRVMTQQVPDANIMDHIPMVNIMPFGTCTALLGPCVPATLTPWVPGAVAPPVILDGQPALDNISICNCMVGGIITVLAIVTGLIWARRRERRKLLSDNAC